MQYAAYDDYHIYPRAQEMSTTITETGVIQTYSGRYIDLLNPKCSDIDIQDIAHHLSMICRFNGACSRFYSVAEHSYHVTSLAPVNLQQAALLHDAAEAYLGDLTGPLKKLLPEFKRIEENLQRVIFGRFGIDLTADDKRQIKRLDLKMLGVERMSLMPRDGSSWVSLETISIPKFSITPATQEEAKKMFLNAVEIIGIR